MLLPTRSRRIAIAVLLALALLGGYASTQQTAGTQAAPASTQWSWVQINGLCVPEYNGHQYYNECLYGGDGRDDQSDIFRCPQGPNQSQGCWQGGAKTAYKPYSPYFYLSYAATQENCGRGWYTDNTAYNQGYFPQVNTYYEADTDWSDFANCAGHDERIYAQHTFVMHSNDPVSSEHTCSQPPSYTYDC